MRSPVRSPATLLIAAGISLFLLAGCAREEGYLDPGEPTPATEFFSDTDFKLLASGISDEIARALSDRKDDVLLVLPFRNRTADRIDMDAFAEAVASELVRKGFKLADRRLRAALENEDMPVMRRKARHAGAAVIVAGRLSSSTVRPKRNRKTVYYLLTVQAVDTATGLVLCSVEREMKKSLRRTPVVP